MCSDAFSYVPYHRMKPFRFLTCLSKERISEYNGASLFRQFDLFSEFIQDIFLLAFLAARKFDALLWLKKLFHLIREVLLHYIAGF